VERDKPKKSESVGQTATVAMETKKRGFNFFFYSFHQITFFAPWLPWQWLPF
jgi:hypothetical protein